MFSISPSFLRLSYFLGLILLPVVVYLPTVFGHYGFRDDYAIIQEANDEPTKVFRVCTGYARPLRGATLEITASWVDTIENLKWMRLAGVVVIGSLSALVFGLFLWLGWSLHLSLFIAAMISLLPAAQVISSWAICWNMPLVGIFAIIAFFLAERGIRADTTRAKYLGMFGGSVFMGMALLSYQQYSFFYLVGVTAAFILPAEKTLWAKFKWLLQHAAVTLLGLVFAVLIMKMIFFMEWVKPIGQAELETAPLSKLEWFLEIPLMYALGIVVLDDELGKHHFIHQCVVLITSILLLAGVWFQWKKKGFLEAFLWLTVLVVLTLSSYSVNLVSIDRFATYRHIWVPTTILLIFAVVSFTHIISVRHRRSLPLLLFAVCVVSAGLAYYQAYNLIAVPQSVELAEMEKGAQKINITRKNQKDDVYIVVPRREGSLSDIRVADEFGTLSIDCDWVPREMLEMTMKDRFPDIKDVSKLYALEWGYDWPRYPNKYEVIIDMTHLKDKIEEE